MMEKLGSNPWLDYKHKENYLRYRDSDTHPSSQKDLESVIESLPPQLNQGGDILDLGAGRGELAEIILNRFPNVKILALDINEEMILEGKKRLKPFGDRMRYLEWDLANVAWPSPHVTGYEVENAFCAVVSSCALHNLRADLNKKPPFNRKETLYRQIYRVLKPGMPFLNLDYLRPLDDEGRTIQRFRTELIDVGRIDPAILEFDGFDGRNAPTTIDDERRMLEQAGFIDISLPYRHLALRLIKGTKSEAIRLPLAA